MMSKLPISRIANRRDQSHPEKQQRNDGWTPLASKYDTLAVGNINGKIADDGQPHDEGLERASKIDFKPGKAVTGDPQRTLFIGRLNPDTKDDQLSAVFAEFGRIKSARVIRNVLTGHSRRYAFVEFESRSSLERAYKEAHGLIIDGKPIIIDREHGRLLPGWVPRRLGGGFGGDIKSGQLRFGCRALPWKMPRKIQTQKVTRDM